MHTQVTVNDLKQKVDLVLGRQNCELQLKNVRLINVFTGQIISGADIFIHNGKIVDAGLKCQAKANEFFEKLDINIRTHLRCLIWRAWKKPKTRERELRKRGLDEYNAWKSKRERGSYASVGWMSTTHGNQLITAKAHGGMLKPYTCVYTFRTLCLNGWDCIA